MALKVQVLIFRVFTPCNIRVINQRLEGYWVHFQCRSVKTSFTWKQWVPLKHWFTFSNYMAQKLRRSISKVRLCIRTHWVNHIVGTNLNPSSFRVGRCYLYYKVPVCLDKTPIIYSKLHLSIITYILISFFNLGISYMIVWKGKYRTLVFIEMDHISQKQNGTL